MNYKRLTLASLLILLIWLGILILGVTLMKSFLQPEETNVSEVGITPIDSVTEKIPVITEVDERDNEGLGDADGSSLYSFWSVEYPTGYLFQDEHSSIREKCEMEVYENTYFPGLRFQYDKCYWEISEEPKTIDIQNFPDKIAIVLTEKVTREKLSFDISPTGYFDGGGIECTQANWIVFDENSPDGALGRYQDPLDSKQYIYNSSMFKFIPSASNLEAYDEKLNANISTAGLKYCKGADDEFILNSTLTIPEDEREEYFTEKYIGVTIVNYEGYRYLLEADEMVRQIVW